MKNNILFKGIIPALVSPIDDFGRVKEAETKKLVRWLVSQDINGFYICGTTGEGLALDVNARKKMLELTLEACEGKVPVIDHIGSVNFNDAVELARHAKEAGAAAISSVPPIYFNYGDDDIEFYYKTLCEESGLPMLMYGIANAGAMPSLKTIDRIMHIDGVIGIKWTFQNFYMMQQIKTLCGGNINLINGPDEALISGLAIGADAGIGTTYNLMPGLFVKLYKAFRAGKTEEAKNIQIGINKVITALLSYNCLPATKALLCHMGFDVGYCARPMKRITGDEYKAFISEVTQYVDFEKQIIL